MSNTLNVGFITTVSGRWPRELPNKRLVEYSAYLKETFKDVNIIDFDVIIDSPEMIKKSATVMQQNAVDIVIMLYGAFTGDDVGTFFAETLKVPMIMWAPYEPELNGGRLLANALVALTMNAASVKRLGYKVYDIYGDKEDSRATDKLKKIINAYSACVKMKGTMLGLFGYRPTAFYNCAFDEALIRKTFGIRIESTDLKVIFDRMDQINMSDVLADNEKMRNEYTVDGIPDEYLVNHSKLYFAMKQIISEMGYDYSAIKCWPEMGNLKTTPCAVLGRLMDDNQPVACEGDVDATLAMIAERAITNKAAFITDLININEDDNYITFWHCGNAAPSLQADKSKTILGDHPLAGQGTAFRTTLKTGDVTIARFCNIQGKYKLFITKGEAIPANLYTPGSMVNVKTKAPVRDVIEYIIANEVPHHYSIIWEDVAEGMKAIADILGIEILEI